MGDQLTHADIVRRFYELVGARDGDGIRAFVDEVFAEDVVLDLPPSLPYGGRHVGAARLRKMFSAMASSPSALGPVGVVVTGIIEQDDEVAAHFAFDYCSAEGAVPMSAVELWSFSSGRVREIRAYYWDTAACVAAARPAGLETS